MKRHKDMLSHTSLKDIVAGKYNKVVPEKTAPMFGDGYIMRRDGWRRKSGRP